MGFGPAPCGVIIRIAFPVSSPPPTEPSPSKANRIESGAQGGSSAAAAARIVVQGTYPVRGHCGCELAS
ncbi:hypothetical protein GUJ93_ZPchr0007g4533 [Zizania palustris]|uniref:Uncharacterized protein n=1 Tax=Zizania palustris TaxID=103762 RepID=A0A8J5VYA2_ZIZPA|nr:hypothetical protein GUJ93_ZPchr0007g4533 [Zizania palustris]